MKNLVILLVFLIPSIITFNSCQSSAVSKDNLIGTWKFDKTLSDNEVKKMMGDEALPAGMKADMNFKGTTTFLKGERYNNEANLTVSYKINNEVIPLEMYIKDTGTWKMEDNSVITISENAEILPINDMAKEFFREDPDGAKMFAPPKGLAESAEILDFNGTSMKLKSDSQEELVISYTKS